MKDRWQMVGAAKVLLGLNDTASVQEIKQTYRRMAQASHPDLVQGEKTDQGEMQDLNAAYSALLEHCATFPIPLSPPEETQGELDPEDWWLNRFGEDALWGRKRGG